MTDPETAAVCAAAGCARPADPVICAVDIRRLGDWLAQLGTEYDALDAAPSMQGREPGSGGPGSLASQRTPIRLDVAQLRGGRRQDLDGTDVEAPSVLHVLGYWADGVREQRGLVGLQSRDLLIGRSRVPGPPCASAPDLCRHASCADLFAWLTVPATATVKTERRLLADHLDWICEQDAAGAFFDAIRLLYGRLRAANDGPRTSAVRCRRTVDGAECGGRVSVVEGTASCAGCGHTASGLALARAGAA